MVTGSPENEASINTNQCDMSNAEAAMIDNVSSDITEETDVDWMNDRHVSDVITVNDNTDKTNNHLCDGNPKAEEIISDKVETVSESSLSKASHPTSSDDFREEVEKIGE